MLDRGGDGVGNVMSFRKRSSQEGVRVGLNIS